MGGRGQEQGYPGLSTARRLASWVWGAVALGLIVLAYLTARVRPVRTPPEQWLLDGLAVGQSVAARLSRMASDGLAGLAQLWRLRQENERLRRELEMAHLQLQLAGRAMVENRWLREALQLTAPPEWRPLAAEVLHREPARWYALVVVGRGRQDGVTPDLPVITPAGVVGQVVAVTERTATVRLLTDVEAAAGGLVVRTGDLVLVQGMGQQAWLRVKSLTGQASFAAGDEVVTSGLGGIYPRGLRVGVVRASRTLPGGMGREGWLEPAVDFGRLSVVYILLPKGSRR